MLSNGNVLWTCDNCGGNAEISWPDNNAVAIVCVCDGKVHPECNNEWFYKGLYWERIPMENRERYSRERYEKNKRT